MSETTVRIHGYPISTWTRTLRMTCAEKGVDHELVPVPYGTEAHGALHPFRRMPILEVGEVVVFETLAATGYVDEAFEGPSLQPADVAGRVAMRTWMGVCGDYLFRRIVRAIPRDREPTADELDGARETLGRAESLLDGDGFLVGDAITLADLYLAPQLANCREKAPDLLAETPRLTAWLEAIEDRPSFGLDQAGLTPAEAARVASGSSFGSMQEVRVVRLEPFPDLDDEVVFPRLSEAKLHWLGKKAGERRSFAEGEVLYEHGVRDAPFFILLSGRVEFVDRKPGKDVHVAAADGGTYIGDIAAFTGEPTISAAVAVEPTETLVFERGKLRKMVADWPEFGEMVFRTLLARRAWHEENGYGVMRLIAPQASRRAFEVRDLLERNLLPVRWYDSDTDPESEEMLRWLEVPREEVPILVHARQVFRNPSPAQVARSLGLRAEVDGERFDLVVLGAGPAGLAAAVYGGSEGLRTLVVESWAPGGQAGTSTRIENYLGFPTGIGGRELTTKATLQARRFDAVLSSYHRATELADGPEGLIRIDLDDGQHVLARSLVMATGARWRELKADGIDRFRGAGVYHAAMATDSERARDKDVIVIGGGNSAGQAAVSLSRKARSVRVIVRGKALKATMSRYLVDRVERSPRIEVMTETEVVALHGTAVVESVTLQSSDGAREDVDTSAVYVMIGADPCTEVSDGMLATDDSGFLLCGDGAHCCEGHLAWPLADREPALLETVRPGVFAAGDVRVGAANRVAGAVGDGALVVRFAHELLSDETPASVAAPS